jgi:hypothetical protein
MITAAEIQMIRNADPGAVLPGIDTMAGNPYATSTLLDVTKLTLSRFDWSGQRSSFVIPSYEVIRGMEHGGQISSSCDAGADSGAGIESGGIGPCGGG